MKNTNYATCKILLFIFFLASQSIIWELALKIIPADSSVQTAYPAFQIGAAFYYSFFCIFFTENNEQFISFWEKHSIFKKIFNAFLSLSIYISIGALLCLLMLPAIFSFTNNNEKEIQLCVNDAKEKIKEAKNCPVQMQCFFPVFLITVIAILLATCHPSWLSIFSKISNLLSALINLPFVLNSVNLTSLQNSYKNLPPENER